MALQGTIDTFPLAEVLQLLCAANKSGRLTLDGDRGTGVLWVTDGSLIGGEVGGRSVDAPAQLVFELLRFGDGQFVFEAAADVADDVPGGIDPVALDQVLAEATALAAEWEDIQRLVPSTAHRVVLADALPEDRVTIDGGQWEILAASGPGPSVALLGEVLGLDEIAAGRRVADLVEAGLLQVLEPAVAPVAPADLVAPAPLGTVPPAGAGPVGTEAPAGADADPSPPAWGGDPAAPPAQESFPDHFPIDDLVGAEDGADDPWTSFDPQQDGDRFAAAQGYADQGYADQGYAPQGDADQGYTDQGYAPQGDEHAGFDDPGAQGPASSPFVAEPSAGGEPAWAPMPEADAGAIESVAPGYDASYELGQDTWTASMDGSPQATYDAAPPTSFEPPADDATDEVLRQMSRLSPKAAEAIAAALGNGVDEQPGGESAGFSGA